MAKKDMLTPHSNIQYGAVIVIILVCIAMIVVPIWQHTRKLAVASLNYNQTVTLGDYYVMLNNAAYDSEQKKFVCDMYIKCKKPGTTDTVPTIYSVASGENLDEFKKYELSALPNEYGQTLTVLGVPSEAQYVRVYLESITPEYKLPDKTDAFGNIIEGEVVPAVNRYLEVVINLSGLAQSQGAVSTDFNTETEATEISQTPLDTSEKFPEPSEPSKTTISTTETTISKQTTSVTTTTAKKPTTTTTATTKKPMVTTSKKPATTTTTTTKAKTTTTAKKTTTTTTTTTAKKTTTTTKAKTTTTTTTTIITGEVIPTGLKISCPVAVNGVITLNVGGSAQLTAEFTPADVTDKSVVWNSRRPEVVTVDKYGKLTAVGKGTTTVSCETVNGRFKVAIMVKVV